MEFKEKINLINKLNLTRRNFIETSIKGIGAIAASSALITILDSCSNNGSNPTSPQNNSGGNPVTFDISSSQYSALQNIGGSVATGANALDPQGLLLYRESQAVVKAYSRQCTHQQCTVGPFQNGISTCPCHGSQYNTSGSVVRGPAPQALKSYTTKLDGNILTVS
ncbi:ubiquinol-cytochrome c reductase iron-sulfur subunit [Melioribacteraceae bacterium 4301-Me]|uniref:ubiquinol-cytochrome c reductase iron-sulfur subunit n=1 Tax=Pyranulibacter aquaticus TaxID=3163344 RepID=UPI003598C0B1